jgi:hypothetical protein
MAFQKSNGTSVPHATNYSDLLDKVVAFAVATGSWVVVADNLAGSGYIILKGLDYTGDKAIYVAIKRFANAGTDTYGWMMQGYTGYTGAGFSLEPGAITGQLPAVPLWNDSIPYWLSVNPRRILLIAKVSGVYMGMYLGLMLPYGSTGQWQYPLVIGGTNVTDVGVATVPRYSDTSAAMTVPFIPSGSGTASNLMVRASSGSWLRMPNGTGNVTVNGITLTTARGSSPYLSPLWAFLRANIDGQYPLRTIRLMRDDTPDALGYLDGVKMTTGHLLSSEDTITDGGDTYSVFQNTFRVDVFSFFAVKES